MKSNKGKQSESRQSKRMRTKRKTKFFSSQPVVYTLDVKKEREGKSKTIKKRSVNTFECKTQTLHTHTHK